MKKTIIFIVLLFSIYTAWSQSITPQDFVVGDQSILKEENATKLIDNEFPSFKNIEYFPGASKPDSLQLLPVNSSTLKWYTMFERIPGDWITCWDLTVKKENIPVMIGIGGLTAVLVVVDHPIWDNSRNFYESSVRAKNFSNFFKNLGDGRPQFGLSAAFAAYGLIAKDDRALRTGSEITEAILACGTIIQVIKHITGRESPFVSTKKHGRWDLFPNQIQYHKHVPRYDAFPSGHIATSLATLSIILENYPETKPWLQPLGYAIVACVGVGLGTTGIHWWSDFPLGLYLGYQFGLIAAHPEGLPFRSQKNEIKSKITIAPSFSPLGTGVVFSYHL